MGLEVEFKGWKKSLFSIGVEHHWFDYSTEANGNLRSRFAHPKSFEHETDGTGFVFKAEATHEWQEGFSAGLSVNDRDWLTKAGTDRTFFYNGTTVDTKLEEVHWESTGINLQFIYRFHLRRKKKQPEKGPPDGLWE